MINIISKSEYLKNNKKPSQEKVWNEISSSWRKYRSKEIISVKSFLKNKKGKIIDIGCGSGRNMFYNENIEYTGIDFSEGQLKEAKTHIKENNIKAKLIKGKAENLSKIRDNYFDHGLFIASLHCIETEINRLKALKEFYRVLKPKAKALITIWNSEDARFNNLKKEIYMSWKENNLFHMRYYYLFDRKEIKNLIEKTGFKILKFKENKIGDRFERKNWIIEVMKQ